MDAFRTPEERFEGLPQFDHRPRYREVDGLRLGHIEAGDGPPVVMLHGEPAWSFIYRKLIPPLRDAGYRCIVPDHPGFGRSDKPFDPAWYRLDRLIASSGSLLEDLALRDVTLVVHDWGGPVGLSLAVTEPERIARIVVLDTTLDPTEAWMNESWVRFREFVERTEELPIGAIMRATCASEPTDEVLAAYDAPFPARQAQGGTHGLPLSVPRTRETPPDVGRLYQALRDDPRPMLVLWGELDIYITLATGQRLASAIGRRIDHVVADAGHAIQEDQGELVGSLIAEWLVAR
jgi:haloalkane dehalogenase